MERKIESRFLDVIDDQMVEILRAKTPAETLMMTAKADRVARQLEAAGFRLRHPDWTEDQIQREIAARRLHGSG